MLQKLLKLLAASRESDHKLDWLREQLKWRYFAFRHQKAARLNAVFDRLHAVDTATELPLASAGVPLTDVARGNGVYRPLTETLFRRAMASVRIDVPAFTFVDIGSGKGKVLFMASDLPFKRIIGIVEKLDRSATSEDGRPVILIYTNIRSVSEVGNVFDGLQTLRTVRRTRNFVVIANAAARTLAR